MWVTSAIPSRRGRYGYIGAVKACFQIYEFGHYYLLNIPQT